MLLALPTPDALRRVVPDDFARIVQIASPRVSPDGRRVAYVVSRCDLEKDAFRSEIDVMDLGTRTTRVLTRGRASVSDPHWSPTGDRLAFLSAAKEGDESQVYVMPMDGGDATRATDVKEGVQALSWSPDGRTIAFFAADPKPVKTGRESFVTAFRAEGVPYLTTEAPTPIHAWVVPAEGGEPREIGKDLPSLQNALPPGAPPGEPSWSPDGRTVYAIATPSASYADAGILSHAVGIDVATGASRPLTGHKGFDFLVNAGPAGVAYWTMTDMRSQQQRVFVAPASGGPGVDAAPGIDACLYLSEWMPDGRSLLVGGNDRERAALWRQPLGGAAQRLDLGDLSVLNNYGVEASVGRDGSIVFVATNPRTGPELYRLASADAKPEKLTDLNAWVRERDLGRVEVLDWRSSDGRGCNGTVTYPPAFDPAVPHPVLVMPHGGPNFASLRTFSLLAQAAAARGYVVFQPNYRGSDNLGAGYMAASWNDTGKGPGEDVWTGLAALRREPGVSSDRASLYGWSYGGYMSAWMLGHYKGWRCGVVGAAVLDMAAMRTLSDSSAWSDVYFAGKLWKDDQAKAYADQSPITAVRGIKAPTLILADTGDQRVPTAQSFVLYHALKELGTPVEFELYRDSAHFPGDPVQTIDVYQRVLGWVERYMPASPAG